MVLQCHSLEVAKLRVVNVCNHNMAIATVHFSTSFELLQDAMFRIQKEVIFKKNTEMLFFLKLLIWVQL